MVDALAGHFDDVVRGGERFRIGWERAGRPVAPNLARASYAVAMVHGMRRRRRAPAVRGSASPSTSASSAEQLAGFQTGWAPTFDALLALHRDDPDDRHAPTHAPTSTTRRCRGSGTPGCGGRGTPRCGRRPPCSPITPTRRSRLERSRHAARDNPIATAIVERAAAIATGDHDTLDRFATTFARLGCPYQQARSRTIAAHVR